MHTVPLYTPWPGLCIKMPPDSNSPDTPVANIQSFGAALRTFCPTNPTCKHGAKKHPLQQDLEKLLEAE